MVDKFEFLKSFNNEIYKNCKTAEFLINVMENFNSSLSSARIALELLCAEENPSHYQYDSLDEKVRSFVSRTNPDDNICNALKAIKTNGNAGSHASGSTRKAKDTIELLEQVLIWYVCGYRGKKYKEADFHPSELRYVDLYCKDLKSLSAKSEKAANGKKVVVEAKNNVVQKNTISIPENKPDKPATINAPEAAPISSAIDKEEKKRLKLERKAQEEAERKAKRNAERELRKQLQKEQKAKALEEAKRRNEEAVAKANAKIQAKEAKKLAKEQELEQKRIRAEQRVIRQEQKQAQLAEELRKLEELEKLEEELERQRAEQEQKNLEEARKASRMAWERQQQKKEHIEQSINNGTDFALDLLVEATLKKDINAFGIFNKYLDRLPQEMTSLEARYSDEVNEVYSIIKKYDFKSVSYNKLLNLTKIFSEFTFKMSMKKLVLCSIIRYNLINNNHKDIFDSLYTLFWHVDQARNEFCEIYTDVHANDAEKRFSKSDLFYKCCALKGLQEEVEERVDRISIRADSYIDFIID